MRYFLICILSVTFFASCLKEPKCEYNACSNAAPASEKAALKAYLDGQGITATEHCSGVFYTMVTEGTGSKPSGACAVVGVAYQGWLTSGVKFDGSEGITFGLSEMISGWRNILPLMKVGGKVNIYIPPSLGYSSREIKDNNGNIVIPANSILIFEVSLLAI